MQASERAVCLEPHKQPEQGIAELRLLPGQLPAPGSSTVEDPLLLARSFFPLLVSLLTESEKVPALLQAHLYEDGFWRDFVAFTHTLRTFHRYEAIQPALVDLVKRAGPIRESFVLIEQAVQLVPMPNGASFVNIMFCFNIAYPQTARCTAMAKIIPTEDSIGGKLWILTTFFDHFVSHQPLLPEALEIPVENPPDIPTSTDVLVIGAGQSGLSLSCHLRALGVDHVVVEREPSVGNVWRKRYKACKLHTSPAFSGLPYADWPADSPVQIPASMVADCHEAYVRRFSLPVYSGRSVKSAVWDSGSDTWEVVIESESGTTRIAAKHIVLAIGVGCRIPFVPSIPNRCSFLGSTLHSVNYTDASSWRGKRALIIGSGTTAMDVASDFVEHGAEEVWMVQRSPTRVYPLEDIHEMQRELWDGKKPTDLADMIANADPMAIQARFSECFLRSIKPRSAALFDQLRQTSFKFIDEGSHLEYVYVVGGKHYLDVGALQRIISGEIKVKSDAEITGFTSTGLAFADGQTIDADVVIYATGFEKSWRNPLVSILGPDVASKVQTEVWGVNTEGEIRGFWKPSGYPRLWMTGGDMHTARFFGKLLAVQIMAALEGIRMEAYVR